MIPMRPDLDRSLTRLALLVGLVTVLPAGSWAGPPPRMPTPDGAPRSDVAPPAAATATGAGPSGWSYGWLPPTDKPLPDGYVHDIWGDIPKRRAALPGDAAAAFDGCEMATAPEGPLDLRQAVEAALCRNPQTRLAWAQVQSQAAQVGQARGAFLPSLTLSANRNRDDVDTKFADGLHNPNRIFGTGQSATLNWVLYDLGTRRANLEQARQTFNAALASQDAAIQTVFSTVAQAYYDAWAAQAATESAAQAERTAAETLQAARVRSRFGAVAHVDELQAQAAASQAALAHVRAEGNLSLALGNLAAILGLDARTPLRLLADPALDAAAAGAAEGSGSSAPADLTTDAAAAMAAFRAELDQLMDETLAAHPSVRAAQAQLAAAQARRNAVIGEGLPSLSLTTNRYLNGRPNTPLTSNRSYEMLVTLQLQVPIFEGFARNYRIRDAQSQISAREADLDNARLQASLDVWRQYQTLRVESTAFVASADLLGAGRELLDAARARYAAGAVDILEVVNAQKDLANAQQERIRALAGWRAARLRLLGGLGKLGLWAVEGSGASAVR
jgi:outer membrane protein